MPRGTLRRIFESVSEWYDYLVVRRLATVHPVNGLDQTYSWDDGGGEPSNSALDVVRALYPVAGSSREELVVVALCAWGLRSSEVAAMHVSQFVLETDEDPHIVFEERKKRARNG